MKTSPGTGAGRWVYWTNRAITDADGRIVEILSVGNDITGQRQVEAELRRLATTDSLTGAFNRRRFFQKARQEFLRHQRYGHPFAILLMDMDHFKKINDTHGHPVGDTVLKTFVDTCQRVLSRFWIFSAVRAAKSFRRCCRKPRRRMPPGLPNV